LEFTDIAAQVVANKFKVYVQISKMGSPAIVFIVGDLITLKIPTKIQLVSELFALDCLCYLFINFTPIQLKLYRNANYLRTRKPYYYYSRIKTSTAIYAILLSLAVYTVLTR